MPFLLQYGVSSLVVGRFRFTRCAGDTLESMHEKCKYQVITNADGMFEMATDEKSEAIWQIRI